MWVLCGATCSGRQLEGCDDVLSPLRLCLWPMHASAAAGVIKVADFGLSKSLTPMDKHTNLNLSATYKLTGETGSYR